MPFVKIYPLENNPLASYVILYKSKVGIPLGHIAIVIQEVRKQTRVFVGYLKATAIFSDL